jgi:diguanylate cyclase
VGGAKKRFGQRKQSSIDAGGERYFRPSALSFAWATLIVLLIVEAVNEIFGVGGSTAIYEGAVHDIILAGAAVLVVMRAIRESKARSAWLLIGIALGMWCIGSVGWSIVYGAEGNPPFPTFADIFWLSWYPLMAFGIVGLIRVQVHEVSWHRWMDGIAVMLVILAAGVALVIEPAADGSLQSTFATIIDFSYPVLDILLVGCILGAYGLLAWHPDRTWLLLGAGILLMTGADALFAVQEVGGVSGDEHYSFVWTAGALLIAFAAWVRVPARAQDTKEITGLRAVALPLIAQGLAAAIQIYAFFGPIGRSERIVTVAVLFVSSVQIYMTRPRSHSPT